MGPSDPGSASNTPFFLQATRWKSFLLADSKSYRLLEEERKRGWNSPSLDQWYASRRSLKKDDANKIETSGDNSSIPTATALPSTSAATTSCSFFTSTSTVAPPPEIGDTVEATATAKLTNHISENNETSSSRSLPPPSTAFVTSFKESDIERLTSRYAEHAKRTWGKGWSVRKRNRTVNSPPCPSPHFPTRAGSRNNNVSRSTMALPPSLLPLKPLGNEVKVEEEGNDENVCVSHEVHPPVPSLPTRSVEECSLQERWKEQQEGVKKVGEHSHSKSINQRSSAMYVDSIHTGKAIDSAEGLQNKESYYQFLDLGCAPGGVSSFLTGSLQWGGVGVTLGEGDGGIPVCHKLLRVHEEHVRSGMVPPSSMAPFLLFDGDITCGEDTWTLRSFSAFTPFLTSGEDTERSREEREAQNRDPVEPKMASVLTMAKGGNKAGNSRMTSCGSNSFSSFFGSVRFRFIHGGAVQDYGQRREHCTRGTTTPSNLSATGNSDENGGGHSPTTSTSRSTSSLVANTMEILPWFTLLRPQLRLALQYIAPGGSFLFVHGAPHCASFFILLYALHQALGEAVRVRVFETMHLAKAPVYVLLENVMQYYKGNNTDAEERRMKEEEWRHRQTVLLQSMHPNSDVVCPYFICSPALSIPTPSTTTGTTLTTFPSTLRKEKEIFWLGESEDGMKAAKAGYLLFHGEVENVWDRMRIFLQRRRYKVENMDTAGQKVELPKSG